MEQIFIKELKGNFNLRRPKTVDFGKSLHIAPLCFYARKSNED